MGDGILVYFGYPQAHEHDAENAVRAGLAIRDWAAESGLEVRIGIGTGTAPVYSIIER